MTLLGFLLPLLAVSTGCGGSNAQAKKAPESCPYRRPTKKKSHWWHKAQKRR